MDGQGGPSFEGLHDGFLPFMREHGGNLLPPADSVNKTPNPIPKIC
jgi:hypothetical protein